MRFPVAGVRSRKCLYPLPRCLRGRAAAILVARAESSVGMRAVVRSPISLSDPRSQRLVIVGDVIICPPFPRIAQPFSKRVRILVDGRHPQFAALAIHSA